MTHERFTSHAPSDAKTTDLVGQGINKTLNIIEPTGLLGRLLSVAFAGKFLQQFFLPF